jgi:hypothetical protein
MRSIPRKWCLEEVLNLAKWRKEGVIVSEIAQRLGRATGSVEARLNRDRIVVQQHRDWTQDEIEYVKVKYKRTDKSKKEIAQALNRTFGSVDHIIRLLGMQKYKCQKWSKKDDDFLIENVGDMTPNKIARLLHRTINSVVLRLKYLKLHRRNKIDWYSTGDVAEMFGCTSSLIRTYIESGKLKAQKRYDNAKNIMWEIRRNNLREFVISYPFELNGKNCDIVQIIDLVLPNGIKYSIGGSK